MNQWVHKLCIRIPFAADPKSLIIAEGDQAFLKLAAAISGKGPRSLETFSEHP
jgi:hypothetical protein